jgi:hypothetical protein
LAAEYPAEQMEWAEPQAGHPVLLSRQQVSLMEQVLWEQALARKERGMVAVRPLNHPAKPVQLELTV